MRLRTARAAVDNTRPRKPAAVLAFDLFWQAGPKTSVAVRTRAASRAHCISLRALAIATVRRQRASTVAAGTTNSPTKGAAA